MTKRRRFLIRPTVSAWATLALGVFCFLGLGWLVSKRYAWLYEFVGSERFPRLYVWYEHAAAEIVPWDSDGDGFSDGDEIFVGTDPRNAKVFPNADVRVEGAVRGGTVFCDEWMSAQGVREIGFQQFRIVPGTVFEIRGNRPSVVLRRDSGSATGPAIEVTAGRDGRLHFEYEFTEPAPIGFAPDIRITNRKTGDYTISRVPPAHGWRRQ